MEKEKIIKDLMHNKRWDKNIMPEHIASNTLPRNLNTPEFHQR